MKVYVMSRVEDGEIQTPKVSRDISNLRKEMKAEYDKVLKVMFMRREIQRENSRKEKE